VYCNITVNILRKAVNIPECNSHGTVIIDPSNVTAGLIFFVSLWMANSKASFEYNVLTLKAL